jgi:hypothetical protein
VRVNILPGEHREAVVDSRVRGHRKLDELIDWYERYKVDAGGRILVAVSRSTLRRWGFKPATRGGPIVYRERTIVSRKGGQKLENLEL